MATRRAKSNGPTASQPPTPNSSAPPDGPVVTDAKDVEWRTNEFAKRDSVPLFEGTWRGDFRAWLMPRVQEGSNTMAWLQKHTPMANTPERREFWNILSWFGTHEFYMLFFPFIWFIFDQDRLGRQLLNLLAASIYAGNWFKDWLCLPRPLPPAKLSSTHGGAEFGFVSTHATMSITVPVYMAWYFSESGSSERLLYMAIGSAYGLLVATSRIWLGMHTPVDVVGGSILGFLLLGVWIISVDPFLEFIVSSGDSGGVLLIPLLFALGCLALHPDPVRFCPCIEDSASLLGAGVGCLIGSWRRDWVWMAAPIVDYSLGKAAIRCLIGSALMFGSRELFKKLTHLILPHLLKDGRIPRLKFLAQHSPRVTRKKAPYPEVPQKLQNLQDRFPDGHVWDVDVPSRFLVYIGLSWVATEFPMPIFEYLGIL